MAQVHEIVAPIVAVEVLRSTALVRRRVALPPLPAGEAPVLELSALPLGLLDGSVRATLHPAEGCRVIDVHVGLHLPPPAERAPVAELKRLRRVQTQLEQQRGELAHRVDELLRLRPVLPPSPRQHGEERFSADPIPAWLGLAQFMREAAADRQRRVRELEERLDEVTKALQQLEERLAQSSKAELPLGQLSKRVRVQLDGAPATATPAELELSYQVPGCRWYPSYELHISRGGAKAELVMNALLAQLTGEDWGEVTLGLSTADLSRLASLPVLPAWRIGRPRGPEARPGWRPLPTDLDELFADFDRNRPPPPPPSLAPAIELPGRGLVAAHPASAPTVIIDRRLLQGETPDDEDATVPAVDDEWAETTPRCSLAESQRPDTGFYDDGPEELEAEAPLAAASRAPATGDRGGRTEEVPPLPAPGPDEAVSEELASSQAAPAEALLAYGQLVLGAPEEGGRGQLRVPRAGESAGLTSDGADSALDLADFKRDGELADLDCLDLPLGAIGVEESAGPFAHRYQTPGAPVPSDGRLHRIGVLRAEVSLDLLHRTLPLIDPSVYRLARFRNPLDRPLLAGPLDVFWDGDYLISTQLKTTPAGGAIESTLGLEPCVRVARNVDHSQREGGILGGRTIFEEEISIELVSHLERPATLEVIERLPISDDRKLEIKVTEESPSAEPFDQKDRGHPVRGARRWRLTLEPRRTERCLLRYQMVLPAKSEIVGGGRRA